MTRRELSAEQARVADNAARMIATPDERRAVLHEIAARRSELRAELDALDALEVGHLEALRRDPPGN